tara:strand:+ start:198 stop:920 length:723 start_codon:yes stop_codon:yes gene_type:complete
MKKRSVCVIGSTGGIGSEITKLFSEEGYSPIISMDLPSVNLDKLSKLYNSKKIVIDLEDHESIKNAFNEGKKFIKEIDVFIFTAGVVENNNLQNISIEDWMRIININLTSLFLCVAQADPWIARNGRVVTLGSMAGHQGSFVTGPAYSASKGGIEAFTKYLASYFSRREITANCIAPGPVETKMLDVHDKSIMEERKKLIPLKRFATPEEIANAALYFSSTKSGYTTGTVMSINAGMVMK